MAVHARKSTPQESFLPAEAILRGMGDAFLNFDWDFRCTFANDIALELMAKQAEEVIGKQLREIFPAEDTLNFKNHALKAKEERASHNFEAYCNACGKWVEVRVLYHSGGIAAIFTDISIRKKAEAIMAERIFEQGKQLAREREFNTLKSMLVTMISHEFRAPLSAVMSSAALIERYSQPDQQEMRVKHAQRIQSSVRTLNEILGNFLALDKLDQGKIAVKREPVNLQDLVQTAMSECDGLLKPGQAMNFHHAGGGKCLLDSRLVRTILHNLLSNAIKFSEGIVDVFVREEAGKIVFEVRDKGLGIPMRDQKHLFEKFFRGGNTGDIQGTGLGLHIVERYAALMEGNVSYQSEEGKGTTFVVQLPTG